MRVNATDDCEFRVYFPQTQHAETGIDEARHESRPYRREAEQQLSHLLGATDQARIFLDDSARTALERADGNWGPAVRRLGGHHASAHATVATLEAAFDEHLAPACRQLRTRADYWRVWWLVVTWAVHGAHGGARHAPICFAVSSSQIELVWKSVQARHQHFQLRQALCEANQYASWVKMLGSVRGRPMALKLPIQKATMRWLLAWRLTSLARAR